jgi:hypothetical protein
LWPDGCSLADLPFDLYRAVEHAATIIHWQENLSNEEVPPEWMWSVEHELEIWFERVQAEREERYGGGSRNEPMVENEYAAEMRKARGSVQR